MGYTVIGPSSYYAALLKAGPAMNPDRYEWSPDPKKLDALHTMAWARDMRLTNEEREAKEEAERICILGDRYWLRAHP